MASASELPGWVTKVSALVDDTATLHGYDLIELASQYDFTSLSYLAWTGELPNSAQRSMLDAILGALIVHGVAPTGAFARGLVRSGVATQVAVAGALLSLGDVHGGAGEQLGQALSRAAEATSEQHSDADDARERIEQAAEIALAWFAERQLRVAGLGHPAHPDGDPRARMLLARARELGVAGFNCAVLVELERRVGEHAGRAIPCNVDGAMTAILEDIGVGWQFSRVVLIVARAAGLGAQVVEEQANPTPAWRRVVIPKETYVGVNPRPVPPHDPTAVTADLRNNR